MSDVDTALVDSLKAVDRNRPIREADIEGKWQDHDRSQIDKKTGLLGKVASLIAGRMRAG